VVVNGRDAEAVQRTCDELRQLAGDGPGRVAAASFDVTDSTAVRAAVADIETDVGPLDILVNNTGVQSRAPFTEVTDADWHRVVDTNLTGAFLVGREVARRMVSRGRGRIINIASLQSEVTRPGITPYAATVQPASSSPAASARPMPRLDPVTSATEPAMSNMPAVTAAPAGRRLGGRRVRRSDRGSRTTSGAGTAEGCAPGGTDGPGR
jgi:hypothetical protein